MYPLGSMGVKPNSCLQHGWPFVAGPPTSVTHWYWSEEEVVQFTAGLDEAGTVVLLARASDVRVSEASWAIAQISTQRKLPQERPHMAALLERPRTSRAHMGDPHHGCEADARWRPSKMAPAPLFRSMCG